MFLRERGSDLRPEPNITFGGVALKRRTLASAPTPPDQLQATRQDPDESDIQQRDEIHNRPPPAVTCRKIFDIGNTQSHNDENGEEPMPNTDRVHLSPPLEIGALLHELRGFQRRQRIGRIARHASSEHPPSGRRSEIKFDSVPPDPLEVWCA